MKKSLQVFKRITCTLGILFIVLGVIPIPAVSVISEVSASTTTEAVSFGLPKFSSINLFDALNQDEGGEPPAEEPPAEGGEEPPAEEPPALPPEDLDPEPTLEPEPTEEPTEEPTDEGCLEGEDCVPVVEDEVGAECCYNNGERCSGNNDCCSNYCSGSGPNKKCACKPDGRSCSGSGQCCNTCYAGTCQTCAVYQACPTECGYAGGDLPDGSCGTHHCDAIPACCTPLEGHCDLNSECCDGLTCVGNKCKVPAPACKEFDKPCGGSNTCCEGLVCIDNPGMEPDKCGYPPTPVDCQYHYSDCVCNWMGCWKWLVIDQHPQNGGAACPTAWFVACGTPVDCVGAWSECEGACGTTGTETFTITTPAENGGLACEAEDGATRDCETEACTPEEECPTVCDYDGGTVPDGHGGLKTCLATSPCPVDCVLGDYGPCSAECGGGTQTQQILVPAQYGGACAPDTRECNTDPCPIDCEGYWGECEGACGISDGVKVFHVTQPDMYGGATCEAEDLEEAACETAPCPEDCVGEWGECVGECTTEPSTGVETFTITHEAVFGGQECEFEDGATQECAIDPCPIDCEWGEWTECDVDCGTGMQTREIAIVAAWGGLECEGPTEQECYAGDCPSQLVLDPHCVTGHLGNSRLEWSFSNPSGANVPVSWSLDGNTGSGTIGPHETIVVGHTTDGPAYHSLTVYWPGGSDKAESSYDCDGGDVTTTGGGGPGGIIPVTGGAGGPTEELLIIPVTGVDLGNELAGFQKLFLYMGLMLFGVTMMLEGVTKKYRI